jgi:hypothetical protein
MHITHCTAFRSLFVHAKTVSRTSPHLYATMTNRAIVFAEKGKALIQEVSVPKLRDDYVFVKVNAVGINPTDWKHIDLALTDP